LLAWSSGDEEGQLSERSRVRILVSALKKLKISILDNCMWESWGLHVARGEGTENIRGRGWVGCGRYEGG